MSMRRTTRPHGGVFAVGVVAALALTLAGCGGDGGGGGDDGGSGGDGKRATTRKPSDSVQRAGESGREPTESIGELKGPGGVTVTLTSAKRDGGGFLTVEGTVTNRGTKPFHAYAWRSKEIELRSQSSVSGASLVDPAGKKRYLILRDTDGECLCTTGLSNIRPDESRPFYAQFPAPPDDVSTVDFQLPTMPSVSIEISG
ncbi:hypothetical protein LRS74_11785 [Streptomyces sp. LX-29]|uniref:hypothetical protein n=1 Tax=Streptomyces sp. LX-29 TaxID=2900152 RepID=UPI00240D0E6C|nr:hypothetical protein [Streptomyces sp. LX-29]WFB07657.1 hypothetical protein LRS74_11785 [Streptomyces sp. LX-29]